MPVKRRIQHDGAGFIKDIYDIFVSRSWVQPALFPDLSDDKTLFIFSDYSQIQGSYKTYSFLLTGRSSCDYFNGARKFLRNDFNLGNRRMSFKALSDKMKLRALPAFLSCAGAMKGFLITFAVDSKLRFLFAEQFLEVWPELSSIKKNTLEDMLRIVHFGALAITTAFCSGQNIIWITDSDAIVANDRLAHVFGTLAETSIRKMFMPEENIGQIGFGLTSVDDGSLEIEDFVAVPDLVAGAICETLDKLKQSGLRVTSKILLKKPEVQNKTNIICEWIGKTVCPLKKFGLVFDKIGPEQKDFHYTFFTIQNTYTSPCEIKCNVQDKELDEQTPIRFDIEDYTKNEK